MLQLLCLLCLIPQAGISDPRDEKIKQFLKRPNEEALELYLWRNPSRAVTLNDIMLVYKKQYNIEIAIQYSAFGHDKRHVLLNMPLKRIEARDKVIPRGLALQLYLDNYPTPLTYQVENGTVWIVPGKASMCDESRTCELGQMLKKTKPKYDDKLNLEETNRLQIPPSDLLGALHFFSDNDRGNFRVFARERDLPRNTMQKQIKVPAFTDKSYDVVLKQLLDQVQATYIVQDGVVLVVPK
ncbi:MAG TPA: hypothetical protein PLX97_08030 [Gemmatales bacterium]|nr:hypothetical protein [Gemmatales bacterium]